MSNGMRPSTLLGVGAWIWLVLGWLQNPYNGQGSAGVFFVLAIVCYVLERFLFPAAEKERDRKPASNKESA